MRLASRSLHGRFGAVVSLLLASCAAGPHIAAPLLVQVRDRPVFPGAVAWAPDGQTLALARRDGIVLLDVRTRTERVLPGREATSVAWAPAPTLLLVERDPAGGRLVEVDPVSGRRQELHAAPGLVSARWLHAGRGWIAVTAAREVRSFGTDARVVLLRGRDGSPDALYEWNAVLPTRDPSVDFASGWALAIPNPVDHGFAIPEFHRAPQFRGYVRFVGVDPFDPEPVELCRFPAAGPTAEASWSPDGRRLVIAGDDGRLRVLHLGAGRVDEAAGSIRGRHPSWHPRRELIFAGGWLATPAAEPVKLLVPDAPDALGVWSPGGDRLAVLHGDHLLVFGDLGVGPDEPGPEIVRRRDRTRDALQELGSLRRDGLIERPVYRERRERWLRQAQEER